MREQKFVREYSGRADIWFRFPIYRNNMNYVWLDN